MDKSIDQRVDRLIDSGMAKLMLTNAKLSKTPSFEQKLEDEEGFKEIKTYLFKKYALKQMRENLVVEGCVYDKKSDCFVVRVQKVWK
eukprot:UN05585